jgi:hypothetical protein
MRGDVISGITPNNNLNKNSLLKNPFQENNFLSEDELVDPGADLQHEDKIYLAMKWGRLYSPAQWVALE